MVADLAAMMHKYKASERTVLGILFNNSYIIKQYFIFTYLLILVELSLDLILTFYV